MPERRSCLSCGESAGVEAFGEEGFDGPIARIVERECALAGRFEACAAVLLLQPDHALCSA